MKKHAYNFQSHNRHITLPMPPYESHLLSRQPFHRRYLFRVLTPTTAVRAPATDFLTEVRMLISLLQSQGELLHYRYAIKAFDERGTLRSSGGGGFGCKFHQQTAIAQAGPGFCHIRAITKNPLTGTHDTLCDLRSLPRVTTDDGLTLIPTRRKRPITLITYLEQLQSFLNHHANEEILASLQ